MDFKLVIEKILTAFKNADIRYALMGGFALGIWGAHRATVDLDFLVHRDDLGKVQDIMTKLGYQCVYQTENVSQYTSSLEIMGEIDFLHAFRKVSLGMLERAEEKDIFGGRLKIRVLKPEDLIGLKVQAMANDPSRHAVDLNDIESLIYIYGTKMDWDLIQQYFAIFGSEELVKGLRSKYSGSN